MPVGEGVFLRLRLQFLGLEGVVEVFYGDEGIGSRYYLLVQSFLLGLEDADPPSLDDNGLADDILGLIDVLPRYVPSRYSLDPYRGLNPPLMLIQLDAPPVFLVLHLAAFGLD